MPRPPAPVGTILGAAIRKQRGDTDQKDLALELGLSPQSLSRIERGTHQPSYSTARLLAKWLGWTVEAVMDAAGSPPSEAAPIASPSKS